MRESVLRAASICCIQFAAGFVVWTKVSWVENRIGGETTWEEGVSYVEFRGVFGVLFCFVSVGAVGAVEGLDVGCWMLDV